MKKSLLIFITLSFYSILAFSQDDIEKIDEYYQDYNYYKYIEKYEKVKGRTPESNRKLAESYFYTGDYEKCEKIYSELVITEAKTPEDVYNYAYVLAMNKKYADANKWMETYNRMKKDDSRAQNYLAQSKLLSKLLKDDAQFKIKNLNLNSEHADFGISYYKDKVVFVSTREKVKPVKRRWNWNKLPFLSMYSATIAKDKQLTEIQEFNITDNVKFHEGPITFNKKGDFAVFTRNNYTQKSSQGITKLQLVSVEKKGEKWGNEKLLNFNNKEYSCAQACLSSDGKTLYFVSDMPGGKGGNDIYETKLQNDGNWSKPTNLSEINTEGDEMFPFIHESGKFFYSTDGRFGLGGLDIFMTEIKDGKFDEPINVGSPVNSNRDDFSLIIDSAMIYGYFASNRDEGKGNDDLFSFELKKPIIQQKTIAGLTVDNNEKLIASANVTLFDSNGAVIQKVSSDANGKFEFTVDANKTFSLVSDKEAYLNGNSDVNTNTTEKIVNTKLIMEADKGLSMYCLVTEKGTGIPIPDVSISIVDNGTWQRYDVKTSSKGEYIEMLTTNKLNDSVSYNFKFEKEGYLPKKMDFNMKLTKKGEYKIHEPLPSVEMERINKPEVVTTDKGLSLYFLVTEKGTGSPLKDVTISIINNGTWKKYNVTTSDKGEYLEILKDSKVNDSISYNIKLEKEGYVSQKLEFNKKLKTVGQYNVFGSLASIELEKIGVGSDLGENIELNNIFFEYEKYNINADAKKELDKIVKIMNDYPKMVIELSAHTDCRGTDIYNLKLSDKRAKATADYIKQKITNPSRISGKGYGETKLKVICNCDDSAKDACTEAQHQKNRRTEFIIVKMQ